jgi:uncharacterized damage-inducible protein DinB
MLPDPASLRGFFDYVVWADRKQLDAARPLSDDACFKDHGWSFGSIHGVMLHMVSAQNVWLHRFTDQPPAWLGDDASLQRDRAKLESTWRDVHTRFADFLDRASADRLHGELRFKTLKGDPMAGPFWRFVTHALNHSTIHRGQLNSMIKLSGGASPAVDYSTWFLATGGARA